MVGRGRRRKHARVEPEEVFHGAERGDRTKAINPFPSSPQTGGTGEFDVVFCSGDERCAKPDPIVFTTTLERLGVKPEEAVFVDDTLEHVQAARALGLHGILFQCLDGLTREVGSLISR